MQPRLVLSPERSPQRGTLRGKAFGKADLVRLKAVLGHKLAEVFSVDRRFTGSVADIAIIFVEQIGDCLLYTSDAADE